MPKYQDVVQEIFRVEAITLGVKDEIKTLKNRVRAYKGWTKRYRRQQQELKQENLAISKERDDVVRKLTESRIKQQHLQQTLQQAIKAKELRDSELLKLDEVIANIEKFKKSCINMSQITYAKKIDLIKEAEKLLFDEPVLNQSISYDPSTQSHMFTDRASIGRNLLDR